MQKQGADLPGCCMAVTTSGGLKGGMAVDSEWSKLQAKSQGFVTAKLSSSLNRWGPDLGKGFSSRQFSTQKKLEIVLTSTKF
jgi:hypothetical protein